MTRRLKQDQSLEAAIRRLRAELKVTNRKRQPAKWAHTHLLLSNKYSDRVIQGQARWLNLRWAQFHIRKAERVLTRRQYPEKWATVHAQYGHLVSSYPWLGGVRRRVLAIRHEKLALQVFTRKAYPAMWAELQQNISYDYGVLFNLRRRPEDFQRCYRHLRNALTVFRHLGNSRIRRKTERQLATLSNILKSRYFKKLRKNRRRPE